MSRASAQTMSRTCEDLFHKEKFLSPSVRITETGRIEARITNSDTALGRLRELTFRAVGEGTGHARDPNTLAIMMSSILTIHI